MTAAERGHEFAFSRTEKGAGTILWRYRFTPEGTGTRVTESYEVTSPVTLFGWFLIGVLYGLKDRRGDLRRGMTTTLERLAALTERPDTVTGNDTDASARDGDIPRAT